MYNEMGLKDIGQLLSCNRDYNFSVGFDKNLILERKKPSWKDIVVVHLDTVTKRKLENV